jgi:glycerol-3-phosphate O-acyltransferase 3/4
LDAAQDEVENVGTESNETRTTAFGQKRRRRTSALIYRKWSALIDKKLNESDVDTDMENEPPTDIQTQFPAANTVTDVIVNNSIEFMAAGIEAIVEDDVTSRFSSAQLVSWNLLTRSKTYIHIK